MGEWIKCSEQMPKMHREYEDENDHEGWLITDRVLVVNEGKVVIGVYEDDDINGVEPKWWDDDDKLLRHVTQWMPLPEVEVKEQENEE